MKDMALLDQMYEKNLEYYKQLTMYILAGAASALLEEQNETLLALQARRRSSPAWRRTRRRANDFANLCQRFEKKLHDLELTRVISCRWRRRSG